MCSLVESLEFRASLNTQAEIDTTTGSLGSLSFFRTIPPERVGLNGEYDHSGLAKRVEQVFRKKFQRSQIERLRVAQRGQVVILSGRVPHQALLKELEVAALGVTGAAYVETQGITVGDAIDDRPSHHRYWQLEPILSM